MCICGRQNSNTDLKMDRGRQMKYRCLLDAEDAANPMDSRALQNED